MAVYAVFQKNKGGAESASLIKDETEYRALRQQQRHLNLLRRVREGDNLAKKHLLAFMYQGHPNDDGTVKGMDRLSRYFFLDIDDRDEAERVIKELTDNREKYQPALIERSARYGAHLVFPRPWGKTILEAQCEMALLLKTELDLNNKNPNRKSFSTSNDPEDLIYIDKAIFDDPFNSEEWEREKAEMDSRTPDLPSMPEKGDKHYKVWEHGWESHGLTTDNGQRTKGKGQRSTDNGQRSKDNGQRTTDNGQQRDGRIYPTEYMGIPYDTIVKKYWDLHNEGKLPTEGNRNSLTFDISRDLAPICDYNPQWLEQIIPRYDGFPEVEWRQTIENGCNEEHRGLRYNTRKAVEAARKETQITNITGGSSYRPPSMPTRLTKFHRTLLMNTPKLYYPTVCEGVWQALATHLHGVKFRYIDGVLHEPHSFGLLIAKMSTGKGCINQPINYIMKDIVDRDAVSRQREAEWKRKNPSGSAKKSRPTDICIQSLMADVTHAAFTRRLADCDVNGQKAIYMHVDEVEMLNKIQGGTSSTSVFAYIKLAYDCARVGQERVGAESVDENAPLRWNCNASTTPAMARRYFRKAVNDGTLSRMNLNTILEPEENDDIPVFGIYDENYAEALQPYIDRLNAASGEISCPQALRLARQLDQENKALADEYDNKAYLRLSFRANVNAYVKAMMLYILNDYKWSRDIEQYVRWSEQWDLWCKLRYFLDFIEEDIRAEEGAVNQGPCNLIAALPHEFTYEQFLALRAREGKTGDGKAVLRKWQSRGYIEYNDSAKIYVKVGKYGNGGSV